MSPYSDLEFALLVQDSSPSNLNYFRMLVEWLELQVINLGETEIKILNNGSSSPTIRGFCFDDGGNTPLGKKGYIELIKTPQEMAELQSERFYAEDLSDVAYTHRHLDTVCKILNEPDLALNHFSEALKIAQHYFGENHPLTQEIKTKIIK
jgi:hypothetical protein